MSLTTPTHRPETAAIMYPPPIPRSAPAPLSLPVRVAAILAAAVTFLVSIVLTLGGVIVAMCGVMIAAAVQRVRRGALRPLNAWIGAAGTVTVVAAGLLLTLIFTLRDDIAEAAATSAAQPAELPAWLERMSGASSGNEASDRLTQQLTESRAFTLWISATSTVLASVIFGAFAGSAGWMVVMLFGAGALGRWPFTIHPNVDSSLDTSAVPPAAQPAVAPD